MQRGVGAVTSRSDAAVLGGLQRGTCLKMWIGEGEDIGCATEGGVERVLERKGLAS